MFKSGDKVKRKNRYVVWGDNSQAGSGAVVTVESVTSNGYFYIKEDHDVWHADYFDLVEPAQETIGFETKVLQALAIGVLSNDQQMLAELVIKRDILQKEIENLNQQIYAKQADVKRLTNFVA